MRTVIHREVHAVIDPSLALSVSNCYFSAFILDSCRISFQFPLFRLSSSSTSCIKLQYFCLFLF